MKTMTAKEILYAYGSYNDITKGSHVEVEGPDGWVYVSGGMSNTDTDEVTLAVFVPGSLTRFFMDEDEGDWDWTCTFTVVDGIHTTADSVFNIR